MSSSCVPGTGQGTEREPPAPGEWVPLDEAREIFAPAPLPDKESLPGQYRYFQGKVQSFPKTVGSQSSPALDYARRQRDGYRAQLDEHLWKLLKAGELIGRGKRDKAPEDWDEPFSASQWGYLTAYGVDGVRLPVSAEHRHWHSVQICKPAQPVDSIAAAPQDLPAAWTPAEHVAERCFPDLWAAIKGSVYTPLVVFGPWLTPRERDWQAENDRYRAATTRLCAEVTAAVQAGDAELGCFPVGDPTANITRIPTARLMVAQLTLAAAGQLGSSDPVRFSLSIGDGKPVTGLFLRAARTEAAPTERTNAPTAATSPGTVRMETAATAYLLDQAATGKKNTKAGWWAELKAHERFRSLSKSAFERVWSTANEGNRLSTVGRPRKPNGGSQ